MRQSPVIVQSMSDARLARTAYAVPTQLWFLVSAVFHYLGPSFAVLLFARVDVLGVAWFRIATRPPFSRSARGRGAPSRRPRAAAWSCCSCSAPAWR